MNSFKNAIFASLALIGILLAGCQTAPKTDAEKDDLAMAAESTVVTYKTLDPNMRTFFDSSDRCYFD